MTRRTEGNRYILRSGTVSSVPTVIYYSCKQKISDRELFSLH